MIVYLFVFLFIYVLCNLMCVLCIRYCTNAFIHSSNDIHNFFTPEKNFALSGQVTFAVLVMLLNLSADSFQTIYRDLNKSRHLRPQLSYRRLLFPSEIQLLSSSCSQLMSLFCVIPSNFTLIVYSVIQLR